ncbi:MAG TPA: DUF4421 family protein [Cyclobacteriaceae bacterium]|nr:DUF4421 family protein [Cyclobacteriaceae bacterium]
MLPLDDADSTHVRKFILKKDFRLFYGGQGNNVSLGSTRDDGIHINGDLYKNTNDYIGAGITYGWLDGDISFSIRGTTYLKEERSNLTQFKLALGYTRRKMIFRAFYNESKGVVISESTNEFESTPSLHEVKLGMQITYLFNPSKYSYRASMYQSEYQVKTAGSFLLRFDPFYRSLGTKGGSMIPAAYDLPTRFGEQAGLEYIRSPGLLVLPGYGINIVVPDTHFFISPIVFAGLGFAQNIYETTTGKGSFTSVEYATNVVLNAGYNGSKYYSKIQFSWSSGYTTLNPTYLTNSNLTCVLVFGIRFQNLKFNK